MVKLNSRRLNDISSKLYRCLLRGTRIKRLLSYNLHFDFNDF